MANVEQLDCVIGAGCRVGGCRFNAALFRVALALGLSALFFRGAPAQVPVTAEAGVEKSYLGLEFTELSRQARQTLGLSQDHAHIVVLAFPSSPAERAGIATGDVILEIDGTAVPDRMAFAAAVAKLNPGQQIWLRILRERQILALSAYTASAAQAKALAATLDAEALKERQIAAETWLLALFTRTGLQQDWANMENTLGYAYQHRIKGSRADNLEEAIKAYNAALTVLTREAFPQQWARVQNNLGNAYRSRIEGNPTENLEEAIKDYSAALTVFTREAFPQDWAHTENNLGYAYQHRIKGSRAENLEEAIKAFAAALKVFTREAYPQDWARTQDNLFNAVRAAEAGWR